jgi:hypothetical protein
MTARRSLVLVAATCVLLAGAALTALSLRHPSHAASAPSRPAAPRGCVTVASQDGYPPSYIARPVTYTIHPPIPVAGWRGPADPLRFRVLFHSLFHGYLVISYPPDLPAAQQTALRRWVNAHRADRVVGTPTRIAGTARIDAAEWGWELRCDRGVPSAAQLDRFAARRQI